MDAEVISHCIGPLSYDYLKKLPHHVVPCMNLHKVLPSEENTEGVSTLLCKPFPYSSSVPIPLTPLSKAPREVLNGCDPTTTLIREKLKWQMKKEKIIKTVRKDKNNISRKVIKKAVRVPVGNKAVAPRGIVLLAQHLDRDPDPCFSGAYNWYYTGGTLATLDHEHGQYLLNATHSGLDYTKIVEGQRVAKSSAVELEGDDPVYQITTNSKGAAVRQRSCVSLLSADTSDDDELRLSKVHSLSDRKHPFMSVALRDNCIRKYCTLSNKRVLKLWDVEYSKGYKTKLHLEPGEGVTVTDQWSSLQYLDNGTLLLADRCCLHILDVRVGMREEQLAWCPKKIIEQCEELSYVVRSCLRDNVVYTTATHQALCLDLRFGFCQRWTHMMAAPPYLGFTQASGDSNELVCLGSQILSDCVAVVNTWRGDEPQSQHQPSSLPLPVEGLLLARQRGLCLDPTLTQRCTQSMTGLGFLPADNELYVVRQSATADVFIQSLSRCEEPAAQQLTDNDMAAYSDWCSPSLSLERDPTTLTVTGVEDFRPLFEAIMTDLPVERAVREVKSANTNEPWQLSKKYLENCVDLLAGKMLAVWEVEEEDEWAFPLEEEESFVEQDPADKVMNWLDAANPSDQTCDDRNVTEMSTLRPTVTSTPKPIATTDKEVSPTPFLTELTPWMSKLSQVTQQKPHSKYSNTNVSGPAGSQSSSVMDSPSSSVGSGNLHCKKKRTLNDDTDVITTPRKASLSVRKAQSSAKRKFVPGF